MLQAREVFGKIKSRSWEFEELTATMDKDGKRQ